MYYSFCNPMITPHFLSYINRKLKTGNLEYIHLNALPKNHATRLDAYQFNQIEEGLADKFIQELFAKQGMRFTLSLTSLQNDSSPEIQENFDRIAKRLDTINHQNNDDYQEYGVRTFGFGYPLVIRRSKQNPNKVVKAPLIIWRMYLEKSIHQINEWKIIRTEEDSILLNEVLINHLEQEEKVVFKAAVEEYLNEDVLTFTQLKSICNKIMERFNLENVEDFLDPRIEPIPTIDEDAYTHFPELIWSGVFGLYRIQKEGIIQDIDYLMSHFNNFRFENLIPDPYQTSTLSSIDTDPSQEKILHSLAKKSVRVIQGPPGTGKSQALTAIITNTIESGAKCLVVCEKKTALDVIRQNLEDLGCGEFCISIEDTTKDRQTVIAKVRNAAEQIDEYRHNFREKEYEIALNNYNQLKRDINRRHKAVLKKIFGDDCWKEVVGKYMNSQRRGENISLKHLLDRSDYSFDYEEFELYTKKIKEGYYLFKQVAVENHPLQELDEKLFQGTFLHTQRIEIEETLNRMIRESQEIIDVYTNHKTVYGEEFKDNRVFRNNSIMIFSFVSRKHDKVKNFKHAFLKQYQDFVDKQKEIKYFEVDFPHKEGVENFETLHKSILAYQEKIKSILVGIDDFQEFYKWKHFTTSLKNPQRNIFTALIKAKSEDWVTTFESWYLDNVLFKYEQEIGPFQQDDHLIEELNQLTKRLKKMQVDKIISHWLGVQKTVLEKFRLKGGNINTLYNYRKNKQNKRKNSLRKIIHTDFQLFSSFFPVVLVSPTVASSILPMKEGLFEVVIFDEASQLRLEDTFSSYLRGSYRIISGDVHQTPPTNYFGKDILLDIDLEDKEMHEEAPLVIKPDSRELADKESLLQFALDAGYEKSYLDFHYRSRHPFLIEFSNSAFYGSRLTLMPERFAYKPIRFLQVDGVYDKNRTNLTEAKMIVDILFGHMCENNYGDCPTIGIATFNIEQRNLILELIQKTCQKNKELLKRYERLKEDGFFVKNLENIQGDERDIVLISTTFGKNEEGKFKQHFGPLNLSKGYRLLNVLVTRAKYQVYVCTSVPALYYNRYAKELAIRGNTGRAILYAYLAYAQAVEDNETKKRKLILELLEKYCLEGERFDKAKNATSEFKKELYHRLSEQFGEERIEAEYQFGSLKLDFVIKAHKAGKPILAIECDGAAHHDTEEAYLHDIYRAKIITERMKIHYYRVWTTNWWINAKKEMNNLVVFANSIDEDKVSKNSLTTLNAMEEFVDRPLNLEAIGENISKTLQQIEPQVK